MSERKVRLLFVLPSLALEGAQKLVYQIACSLADRYTIGIICLDAQGPLWDECKVRGFELYCVDRASGSAVENLLRVAAILREFRPEVIHAHQYRPYVYAVLGKLFAPSAARVLFTQHGRRYPEVRSTTRCLLNKFLLCFTSGVTAVSEFTAQSLTAYEGISADRISVIRNGLFPISQDIRRHDFFTECSIPAESQIVGYIGSFRRVKNPQLLLDAFTSVAQHNYRAHLVCIGDGPLRDEIAATTRNLALEHRVHLLGVRSPAASYLQSFDVFVLPSLSEGCPLALLEAMGQGIPVIVTDSGGLTEIVTQLETGQVVPVGDEQLLAEAIARVLRDPELGARMAEQAKKVISERFSFDEMLSSYEALYQRKERLNGAAGEN